MPYNNLDIQYFPFKFIIVKINVVYDRDMFWDPIKPIAEELEKKGYEIIHNSPGGAITIGSHLVDVMNWHDKTPIIFIDHGICPRKGIAGDFNDLMKINAFILISGKYYERLIKKLNPEYKDYEIIGDPKFEYFLKKQVPRNKVIKKYSLDPDKPVILYAPTWYHKTRHIPYSHGTIKYIKKVEKACKNYNLIIFPHPRDHKKKYIKYASSPLELNDKVMYYFSASDLLISDFSSVIVNYCYFNKPIIQITDTIDKNMKKYPDEGYVKFQAGEFTKAGKIKKIIDPILRNPGTHKEKREKWYKDVVEIVDGSSKLSADTVDKYIKKISISL